MLFKVICALNNGAYYYEYKSFVKANSEYDAAVMVRDYFEKDSISNSCTVLDVERIELSRGVIASERI